MSIHIARVALTLLARVPESLLDEHLAASARAVGRQLAEQVQAQARQERLGYFPALDYFRGRPGVDAELLQAATDITWFAAQWASGEVRRRLRGAFSSVTVKGHQPCAFLLPGTRPKDPQALAALARHYTPDRLRLHLVVTLLQRGESSAGFEHFARRQALRLLDPAFAELEVVDAQLL